jgi:hypothetical protein
MAAPKEQIDRLLYMVDQEQEKIGKITVRRMCGIES